MRANGVLLSAVSRMTYTYILAHRQACMNPCAHGLGRGGRLHLCAKEGADLEGERLAVGRGGDDSALSDEAQPVGAIAHLPQALPILVRELLERTCELRTLVVSERAELIHRLEEASGLVGIQLVMRHQRVPERFPV